MRPQRGACILRGACKRARAPQDDGQGLRKYNRTLIQKSDAGMPKRTEKLSPRELKEVARLRAKARKRAESLLKEPGGPVLNCDDPDNPPLTDAQLRRMRPAYQVRPKLVTARLRRGPG